MNEPRSQQLYKFQVGNVIKTAEYSDYLYKVLIDEGYASELDNEELLKQSYIPERRKSYSKYRSVHGTHIIS